MFTSAQVQVFKKFAKVAIKNPLSNGGFPSVFDYSHIFGHAIPEQVSPQGVRYRSADDEAFRIQGVVVIRGRALAGRYARFARHMKEVRHAWKRDEATTTYYADNSVEVDEISALTGERRRVMTTPPHGDVCF